MRLIYEAHWPRNHVQDFDAEADARAVVEAAGEGYITTFVRGFDGRDRSSALNKFENGSWQGINIHE